MRKAVRLLVTFLVLCLGASPSALMRAVATAAPATAVNWPQFRFNDRHTGENRLETVLDRSNVPSLQLSWQAQLGDLVDFSSPAVVDGVVYIGTTDGVLWAYPAAGCSSSFCDTPLWRSTSLAQILDSPTVSNGTVYVGSQTSFDSNNGKLDAFAASGCGSAVCKPLWQGLAGKDSILSSSPAVSNGVVYVGTFGHRLFAFDANGCGRKTCEPMWAGATGGSVESTPTVWHGVVYVGSDDGRLYAFDANGCRKATCKPLWTGPIGGGGVFESSPAVAGGLIYISSQHSLAAFDVAGCGGAMCSPVWRAPDRDEFYGGSPAVAEGRVYIGLESGLAVFDAAGCGQAKCTLLWRDFGSGAQASVLSSPTVANGIVYAGRNTGEVLAWRAGRCGSSFCPEIWKGFTQDSIVSSSPTVVNGTVYIGSADNHFPEDTSGRIYVWALP